MRKRIAATLVAGMVAASMMVTAGAASAGGMAKVWVLHAVPGATVDVCVDGSEVRSNFQYKQRFAAELPAGTYNLQVRLAASGECTGTLVLEADKRFKAGTNSTVVAGLDAAGNPALFRFGNNLDDTKGDNARISVRHTAAAPLVDVWVNRAPLIEDFANGQSVTTQVDPGSYTTRVVLAGTDTTAIGPRTFALDSDMAYQVYAAGNGSAGFIFLVLAQPTNA
jgi:hypothetical protein